MMIHLLEKVHPDGSVLPSSPRLSFVTFLLEDYADEWLWRPAMHYRWSFEQVELTHWSPIDSCRMQN